MNHQLFTAGNHLIILCFKINLIIKRCNSCSNCKSVNWVRIKTIFNTSNRGQSLSVLAQEFTTSYTITASDRIREEAAEEAWLERVNINYHFDPKDFGAFESDLVELKE